jgi:hypothetical protein
MTVQRQRPQGEPVRTFLAERMNLIHPANDIRGRAAAADQDGVPRGQGIKPSPQGGS